MSDSPTTVLLIEDNPGDARLIREMLADGGADRFKLECADRLSAGLERLASNDIGLVLLDLGLPDSQGFDTFTKTYAQAPGVPIIVLSGLTDEQLAIKTVQEGAQDYLVKGHLDSHALVRTISYAIERKRTEELLRESETQVRKLFEAIPDSILVHDDEGNILHTNEIGAERLEWSAKDLVGKNLREILTPENTASIADHIKETHKIGWCRFETTYVSRSGWQIVAEVSERPIKFGKEKAILSVARDITERKEAERALLREKNFSAAVMNSSPGLLFVFDDKGNIIQWNRNAEKVTGYSAKEISKMNVLDFVAKEEQKTAAEAMQEVFTKGQSSIEIKILSKPGKKTLFHITGLRTKFENTICVVCTGIDITERKQVEQALQNSYHKLRESLIATVNTLASTVEMKDPYTAGHQRRVTMLACAIAEEMGLTEEQFDGLRMAGLIHDIGKINVPAEILNRSGRISDTEFNIIKTHPQVGYNVLKDIEFPWPVAQIVLQHHERLDGSGYPQGLKKEEIMLEARILAVADVVEAMASHRPYRPAHSIAVALEKITKNRGIIYDPEVVDTCARVFTEKGFTFE
jgi:PAS domain S-box-containing protein/putative nucleotidyltransferase with HDIG domain